MNAPRTSGASWPPPAVPGLSVHEVDTPALIVEIEALERNLERMAAFARNRGIRLRPHAKMHKCPTLGRRQVALGAVGVCCQKTSEAEVMVAGGITDVLVSNEVVGAAKIQRLVGLAGKATVGICVDDAGNARDLSAAARAAGVTLEVYVDVDLGVIRCGVDPGEPALALARVVAGLPNLKLQGLQVYQGLAQHMRTPDERQAAMNDAFAKIRDTRDRFLAAGLPCPIITGAGTGTYELETASGVYNELQAGSYAFMDADYARNTPPPPFEQSLFLLATTMSRCARHAVLDLGLKAHSFDSGPPLVAADAWGRPLPGLEYRNVSDEHGVVLAAPGVELPALGQKVRLIPGHIDPTVNLHDWLVVIRRNVVEDVWPITARGAMW